MNENSIYTLKDYGKVEIVLKDLLDKKGISRNKLCTMIAANYDLINRYYHNHVARVDIDIIARIFYTLNSESYNCSFFMPEDKQSSLISWLPF